MLVHQMNVVKREGRRMMKKSNRRAEVLKKLNALVDALWVRKRNWTRAEKELYEAIVISLSKSAIRQQAG